MTGGGGAKNLTGGAGEDEVSWGRGGEAEGGDGDAVFSTGGVESGPVASGEGDAGFGACGR